MTDFNTNLSRFSTGSVLFVQANGVIAQNNANFFWDNTNKRLNIGTSATTANAVFILQVGNGSADTRSLFIDNFAFAIAVSNGSSNGVFYFGASAVSGNCDGIFSNNAGTEMARIVGSTGLFGVGASAPVSSIESQNTTASVFSNGSATPWTGSTATPSAAITVTASASGGYDSILLFRQATSTGVIKTTGAIEFTGTSTWTNGTLNTQISDMLFISRDTGGLLQERMRITSGGNVGIGAIPGSRLDVYNASTDTTLKIGGATTSTTAGISDIIFYNSSADSGTTTLSQIQAFTDGSKNIGGFSFFTKRVASDSGVTEAMRIAAAGNVGIGVTPVSSIKFHVNVGTNQNFWVRSSSSTVQLEAANDAANADVAMNIVASALTFNATSSTFTGYITAGAFAGSAPLAGDIVARRTSTTGVIYFGDANNTYFYFDGTNYNTGGTGGLSVPGGFFSGASSYHLDILDTQASFVSRIQNANGGTTADGLTMTCGSSTTAAAYFIYFVRPGGTNIGSIQQNPDASHIAYNTSSDRRLKKDIVDTRYGLKDLLKIQTRDFKFKKSDYLATGFIAQELHQVYPHAVSVARENPHGEHDESKPIKHPWAIDYGKLTPLLVKAIQELNEKIERLENKNG